MLLRDVAGGGFDAKLAQAQVERVAPFKRSSSTNEPGPNAFETIREEWFAQEEWVVRAVEHGPILNAADALLRESRKETLARERHAPLGEGGWGC